MKINWKWVSGIGLILVMLLALVAAPLIIRGTVSARISQAGSDWRVPSMHGVEKFQGDDFRMSPGAMGGRGFERNFGPSSRFTGHGFFPVMMPFMFVGGLLRLLIPLGLLALVAYFSYQQGKKAGMKVTASGASPTQVTPVE